MKQITILLAFLIAGITNMYSQDTQQGTDYKDLQSKLEKSNKNLQNSKKTADPKFWMERAKLFQDIANVNTQFLSFGIAENQVKLFYKDPKQIVKGDTSQYIYERFTAYFKNGKLIGWKDTQSIVPNGLDSSLKAYNKAIELDKDNKNNKKIVEGLNSLKTDFKKRAINCYSLQNFDCAAETFKIMADMSDIKGFNEQDTTIIYNAGFMAAQIGDNDDAIKYLTKALNLNYKDPSIITNLKKAYLAKGDTTAALNILNKGIQMFPKEQAQGIIIELINFYINTGNRAGALEYLAKAKEIDPKNRSFYYAEGALYDKMAATADDQLSDLNNQKNQELKQLDDAKKAEFKKTGNNVAKYKPIDDKYQKLKKAVDDKFKNKEDSLTAVYQDNHDKAVSQYEQAIKIDPNYFDAYYNLGVIYYNSGVKLSEQAGKEQDDKIYEAKKNAAEEEFKKAVPYMESAYEVNEKSKPENTSEYSRNRRQTLDVLKNLYYRLRMNDQFERIKKLQESAQ